MTDFPKKTFAWTLLVAVFLTFFHWKVEFFNDQFNWNPAAPWIATFLLVLTTLIAWFLWTMFWAKRRWIACSILLFPVLFFVVFQPTFAGDANIVGFAFRFWSPSIEFLPTTDSEALVDLESTTLNDFNQFLGPDRNAIINRVSLSDSWATPPSLVWEIELGQAWSGFVAVNGFAITQEQRGADECVTCYDIESGELMWIHRARRRHEDLEGMGKVGPRATPTVHEGFVYTTGGTGILDCIDGRTGDSVWSANVPELVGIKQLAYTNSFGLDYTMEDSTLRWGRSPSPLIVDDLVVVAAGGPMEHDSETGPDPTATMIAFDKKTGQERWRAGDRLISYGSPSLATIDGQRQILLMTESAAVGFDAKTGVELWNFVRPGKSNQDANCSQVTVVDENHLILSKGYGLGGELIHVSLIGSTWTAKSIHQDPRVLRTKMTNPVVYQGHAYSLSDGFLECTEIETFVRKWKVRGSFGNGQVLLVGNKLLVHSETSRTLTLVEARPEKYTKLGSIDTIKGLGWNTLCLYGDLLIVRTDKRAACFRLPIEAP